MPVPRETPHPHVEDARGLREYLLARHGTDYGASEHALASAAEEAKMYLAFTDYQWSWQSVAAAEIRLRAPKGSASDA